MDTALTNMQNSADHNNPAPMELVCVDQNGLAFGAAPEGAAANAGSLRTIGNELQILEDLARADMAAMNNNQDYTEAPKDPMLLIESERRNIIVCERHDDRVTVAMTISNQQQGQPPPQQNQQQTNNR